MEKIIAVLSFTGKVGKSVISDNLLLPRMKNALRFQMETINESGKNIVDEDGINIPAVVLKGREVPKLQTHLVGKKSAIVDIGMSNVEAFVLALNQQADAHYDFDYFIVPIEANYLKHNEMIEAIKTIDTLHAMGVEPERIKVIFNKLANDSTVEEEAAPIFKYHADTKKFTLNPKAVIHETPAFKAFAEVNKSFVSMVNDDTNYRQQQKETEDFTKQVYLTKMMRAQGSAKTLNREFNSVFNALFES